MWELTACEVILGHKWGRVSGDESEVSLGRDDLAVRQDPYANACLKGILHLLHE